MQFYQDFNEIFYRSTKNTQKIYMEKKEKKTLKPVTQQLAFLGICPKVTIRD